MKSRRAFIKNIIEQLDDIINEMENYSVENYGLFDVAQEYAQQLKEELENILEE